ncbi:MAG: DUF2232 domain-containing protein [Halothermotrichaceae bacterium]
MDEKKDYIIAIKYLFVIFLLSFLFAVPVLNLVALILLPVPIVFLVVRLDSKLSFAVIVLAALINGLLLGTVIGLYTIIVFGLIGFTFGLALKEGFSSIKVLLLVIAAVLISTVIIYYLVGGINSGYFEEQLEQQMEIMGQQYPQLFQMQNVDPEMFINLYLETVKLLFPAIVVISSIILGSIIYYITLWYLNRKGFDFKSFKSLKYWFLPRWWTAAGLTFALIFKTNQYGLNAVIILFFLIYVQGMAVGYYYLAQADSKAVNFIYFVFVFFSSIMFIGIIVLIAVGLIDMWFNLRKLKSV